MTLPSLPTVPAETPMPSKLHLSISAHVVVQLGEELVTDVEQAFLELAKNAYDADSTTCQIIIEPDWVLNPTDPAYVLLTSDQSNSSSQDTTSDEHAKKVEDDKAPRVMGRIRIKDFGTGIDAEAVTNGWLRISSSIKRAGADKAKEKTKKKKRTPVGDKGLGRLATMKIGRILRMKTAIEGDSEYRTVTFTWDDFTVDRALEDVRIIPGQDNSEPVTQSGTEIEIIGLHDSKQWHKPDYIEKHLVPSLSSLINPFRTEDEFEITIETGKMTHLLQHLDESVLNLASAKFTFVWEKKQLVQTAYIAETLFRGGNSASNRKNFEEIFSPAVKPELIAWLKNDKKVAERGLSFSVDAPWFCKIEETVDFTTFPTDARYPGGRDPGDFKATLHNFMFHDVVKNKLSVAGSSTEAIQAMAQVAIFRDGFRVRAHQDWLKLSENLTTGTSYFALKTSNIVGHFELTNENNPGMIEKSDREGFLDNDEWRGFMVLALRERDFANDTLEAVRKAVNRFIEFRNPNHEGGGTKALVEKLKSSESNTRTSLEKLQDELTQASTLLDAVHDLQGDLTANFPSQYIETMGVASASVVNAKRLLEDVGLQIVKQVQTSHLIAEKGEEESEYGTRLLEAAAVGLSARSLAHELHQFIRQLREGISEITGANKQIKNKDISDALRRLNATTRELAKVITTLDPMMPGSRSLKEDILLSTFMEDYLESRSSAAERQHIAIKYNGDNGAGLTVRFSRPRLLQVVENLFQNSVYWLKKIPWSDPNSRRIEITMTPNGFIWNDSGPGFKPTIESSIFEPYVSDKPSSEGSGLGLHIVSTFLELERSTIRVVGEKNATGRRTALEVDLSGAAAKHIQPSLGVGL